MENNNRNDVTKFFEDMPTELQLEVIHKLERQKKPPDTVCKLYNAQQRAWEQFKADRAESEGGLKSRSYA